VAIENARLSMENLEKQRMEEELNIARDLQMSMLPASCLLRSRRMGKCSKILSSLSSGMPMPLSAMVRLAAVAFGRWSVPWSRRPSG
jgi:hypothetical protein